MTSPMVIVRADVGDGRLQSVRIDTAPGRAWISEIGDSVDVESAKVVDAAGGALLPGFSDHHLHLHALAAAEVSVTCGPPAVVDTGSLRAAVRHAPPDPHGWVRGRAYVETVAGELDRTQLDVIESVRPVRIQHRSGALWMLNSSGLDAVGADDAHHPGIERDHRGRPTGRLWRADDWLRSRLSSAVPPRLAGIGDRLRRLGIVEVTDATPDLDPVAIDNIVAAVDSGHLSGRVQLLGVPLGQTLDHPRVSVGPYKIVVADSDLPDPDELADRIAAAHRSGRSVAVHCVSAVALAILIAAWTEAGVRPGDRIEHAGEVPAETCADLAALKVTVVTQPGFLPDRGDDFLDRTDLLHQHDLYRCGSLIQAGVPVALSSDAPYGPLNPWTTVAAAVDRRTPSGRRVGSRVELLTVREALRRYQTTITNPDAPPRRVAVGQPGDLVILDRGWADLLSDPGAAEVTSTIIAGRMTS